MRKVPTASWELRLPRLPPAPRVARALRLLGRLTAVFIAPRIVGLVVDSSAASSGRRMIALGGGRRQPATDSPRPGAYGGRAKASARLAFRTAVPTLWL